MAEPNRKIKLVESRGKGISIFLDANINDQNDLVIEGQDIGQNVEEYWGDSDYEYWVVVPEAYKNTVLLWLLKERFYGTELPAAFHNSSDFMEWLKAKEIPYHFTSYV